MNTDKHNGEILTRLTHKIARVTGACRSATQALLNGADQDPELRKELVSGIDEELQELELVVENLAVWRALELNTMTLHQRPTDLKRTLAHITARWQGIVESRGLRWQVDLPNHLPHPTADPDRLIQVLNNLLVNALDYTAGGGEVRVQTGVQGRDVWIEVSNTGPGLMAEELAHVFEPFFSSAYQGRFPQGVGLGLSIARLLVEMHGGRLTVESELNQGMRFRVWLKRPASTA
jgi:signal transduction histidine kinase